MKLLIITEQTFSYHFISNAKPPLSPSVPTMWYHFACRPLRLKSIKFNLCKSWRWESVKLTWCIFMAFLSPSFSELFQFTMIWLAVRVSLSLGFSSSDHMQPTLRWPPANQHKEAQLPSLLFICLSFILGARVTLLGDSSLSGVCVCKTGNNEAPHSRIHSAWSKWLAKIFEGNLKLS